jgi:hypothetical protein
MCTGLHISQQPVCNNSVSDKTLCRHQNGFWLIACVTICPAISDEIAVPLRSSPGGVTAQGSIVSTAELGEFSQRLTDCQPFKFHSEGQACGTGMSSLHESKLLPTSSNVKGNGNSVDCGRILIACRHTVKPRHRIQYEVREPRTALHVHT